MRLLQDPMMLLLTLPAVLWAISFHEFCHGYAAKLVGDPTAERSGRLSLNPLDHFDLVGTLMLLFVGFGTPSLFETSTAVSYLLLPEILPL